MKGVAARLHHNTRSLLGMRFGRLVVQEYDEARTPGDHHAHWRCVCDCGQSVVVRGAKLTAGRVVSCGCWRADPAVRQAARLRTPARRRKQIAKLGGRAKNNSPSVASKN